MSIEHSLLRSEYCVMPALPKDELIYRKWHEEVQHLLAFVRLERLKSKDRTLYEFNWETFHTELNVLLTGGVGSVELQKIS